MSKARDDVRTRNSGARHVDASAILRDPAAQRQMIDAEAARAGRRPMQSEREAARAIVPCGPRVERNRIGLEMADLLMRAVAEHGAERVLITVNRCDAELIRESIAAALRAPVAEQGAGAQPLEDSFAAYAAAPYRSRSAAPTSAQEREDEAWLEVRAAECEKHARALERIDAHHAGSRFAKDVAAHDASADRYRRILTRIAELEAEVVRLRAAPAATQGERGYRAWVPVGDTQQHLEWVPTNPRPELEPFAAVLREHWLTAVECDLEFLPPAAPPTSAQEREDEAGAFLLHHALQLENLAAVEEESAEYMRRASVLREAAARLRAAPAATQGWVMRTCPDCERGIPHTHGKAAAPAPPAQGSEGLAALAQEFAALAFMAAHDIGPEGNLSEDEARSVIAEMFTERAAALLSRAAPAPEGEARGHGAGLGEGCS